MILICNEQLKLIAFEDHMAQELFDLVVENRMHLQQWLTWVPFTKTPKDSLDFLQQSQMLRKKDGAFRGGIYWEEQLVGTIGFHEMHRSDNSASVGYWLSKNMTGKGIMTRSVKRILQHGFDDLLLVLIVFCWF